MAKPSCPNCNVWTWSCLTISWFCDKTQAAEYEVVMSHDPLPMSWVPILDAAINLQLFVSRQSCLGILRSSRWVAVGGALWQCGCFHGLGQHLCFKAWKLQAQMSCKWSAAKRALKTWVCFSCWSVYANLSGTSALKHIKQQGRINPEYSGSSKHLVSSWSFRERIPIWRSVDILLKTTASSKHWVPQSVQTPFCCF